MHQFPLEIAAKGQIFIAEKRHRLGVNAEPAPAYEGGSGDETCAGWVKGAHTVKEFHNAQEQTAFGKASKGPEQYREKNHESADAEHRGKGALHGGNKGGDKAVPGGGVPLRYFSRETFAAEKKTCAKGGKYMDEVEKKTCFSAFQRRGTCHRKNESRAAVVAEGKQAFCLFPGAAAFPIKKQRCPRPHRITAQKTQDQRTCTSSVQPEQKPHRAIQRTAQRIGKSQRNEKRGKNEKGKEGGEDRAIAKCETFLHRKGNCRGEI